MSINYNLGIPASTHNPSTDQPNMQANNDAIAQFVAVDHVGFNTGSSTDPSGTHNFVTFPVAQTDPSLVGSEARLYPKLFTGSATNILETYLAAIKSDSTQLNGYLPFVKCMGIYTTLISPNTGPITQKANSLNVNIATAIQNPTNTITITFTTPLPTTNYFVFLTQDSPSNVTITKSTTTLILVGNVLAGGTLGFVVI